MKIEHDVDAMRKVQSCLNPYSNGMKIELAEQEALKTKNRLNPYSNGMKIEQKVKGEDIKIIGVLILILME